MVAYSTPEFRALTDRLGKEYGLPLLGTSPALNDVNVSVADFTRADGTYDSHALVRAYIRKLSALPPGTYFSITHPSVDTQEVRELRTTENVASRRYAQLEALLDPEFLQFIRQGGIELITPDQAVQALSAKAIR
jgi:hypothetical protein